MRGKAALSEEWAGREKIEFGSLLADIETGWSPACDSQRPSSDEWGVIRVSAVTSGRFNPNEAKRLPAGLDPRPELEIRPGDVLVARANGARSLVGVACHVQSSRAKLMLSDKTLRLVPDESVACSSFIAILLSSQLVRRQISNLLNGSSGQNNISQGDVRRLVVPHVQVTEQRAIVAAHAAVERRIEALERVRGKLRVAEGAVTSQALVGNGNDWPVARLEAIASVDAGVTLGAEPVGDGTVELPYLRVANVLDGRIDTTDLKRIRIFQTQYERFALRKGDLLLTEGGDLDKLGRGAVWDGSIEKCLHQNHVFRVRCDAPMSPDFLALYTSSTAGRAYFQSVGKQTTNLASINSTQVKGMPVPVPPRADQERLLGPVRSGRARMETVDRQIRKMRLVQKGLMEDLLSGRVRAPQG